MLASYTMKLSYFSAVETNVYYFFDDVNHHAFKDNGIRGIIYILKTFYTIFFNKHIYRPLSRSMKFRF